MNSNNNEKEVSCIQDLLNHPTLADPAYSSFKEYLRLYQIAYFDQKIFNPDWNKDLGFDEWAYET